jgi:predicted GNAT superfamily acetyltransferase
VQQPTITAAKASDLPALLSLNESALPHLNSLTLDALRTLAGQSCYLKVAHVGTQLAGFLLALDPRQSYGSLNYRWFCQHFERFVYVDRVVVADAFRGTGIGKSLYEDLDRAAKEHAAWLTCEVNLLPPNPGSLVFHHKLGFHEVGQQDTDAGRKRVSLLAKQLASAAPRTDDNY